MLRDHWYPIARSRDIPASQQYGFTLFGEPLVAFRDAQGKVHCLEDRCAHNCAPLSMGKVVNGQLQCGYHGWRFGGDGRCVHIPSLPEKTPIPPRAFVKGRPTVERHGLVWIWPGAAGAADPSAIPHYPEHDHPDWWVCLDDEMTVNGSTVLEFDQALFIENVLDPSHLPFLHDGTIGREGEAQPLRMVEHRIEADGHLYAKYESTRDPPMRVLGPGFWFDPPCHVRVDRPEGTFRRVYHVLPVEPGKCRVLWWIAWRIDSLDAETRASLGDPEKRKELESQWLARQLRIFVQDVPMLAATQKRISMGAQPYNCPVRGDGISVRYRRWRDRNEDENTWFKRWAPEPRGRSEEEAPESGEEPRSVVKIA
ncbi:MAG TPA: aromatic ring-hydroxylating dioxygenase subunit alpha [Myxococcaceae bacterium]|jgi:phenylpropionate dioxygenase-like ring-hydroxylating dioxygenase large terminal subunit